MCAWHQKSQLAGACAVIMLIMALNACLDRDERNALQVFRETRSKLMAVSGQVMQAALEGNAEGLGLIADSQAIQSIELLARRDSSLIAAAMEAMDLESTEVASGWAALTFRVPQIRDSQLDRYIVFEYALRSGDWRVVRVGTANHLYPE